MTALVEREASAKLIAETTSRGEGLRCGDYLGVWEEGDHPYGQPAPCPFCRREQRYTNLWYNGPGSPPSYAWQCDDCGAQGPTSSGQFRGDHYGAIIAARELWDAAALRQPGAEYRRGVEQPIEAPENGEPDPAWRAIKRAIDQFVGRVPTIGKHRAINVAHIGSVVERLDAAGDREAADTIVWLCWHRALDRERERFLVADAAEQLAEARALSDSIPDTKGDTVGTRDAKE